MTCLVDVELYQDCCVTRTVVYSARARCLYVFNLDSVALWPHCLTVEWIETNDASSRISRDCLTHYKALLGKPAIYP